MTDRETPATDTRREPTWSEVRREMWYWFWYYTLRFGAIIIGTMVIFTVLVHFFVDAP